MSFSKSLPWLSRPYVPSWVLGSCPARLKVSVPLTLPTLAGSVHSWTPCLPRQLPPHVLLSCGNALLPLSTSSCLDSCLSRLLAWEPHEGRDPLLCPELSGWHRKGVREASVHCVWYSRAHTSRTGTSNSPYRRRTPFHPQTHLVIATPPGFPLENQE